MAVQVESICDEFKRLVSEYEGEGSDSVRAEAWNLIADFAVEHAEKISVALSGDAQARAEGERAGLERAAQWHDHMASVHECQREITNVIAEDGRIDRAGEEWARRHHSYAAAIRALKVEGETP